MAKQTLEEIQADAEALGIDTTDKTAAALTKEIKAKRAEDQEEDADRGEESATQRSTRKRGEAKATPIAKSKKKLIKPRVESLYPWAVNRSKVERAHIAVHATLAETKEDISQAEIDQRVMDHYVTHGGLVRGQEDVTTVGRDKPIKEGATTTQVVDGTDDEDDTATDAGDEEESDD